MLYLVILSIHSLVLFYKKLFNGDNHVHKFILYLLNPFKIYIVNPTKSTEQIIGIDRIRWDAIVSIFFSIRALAKILDI